MKKLTFLILVLVLLLAACAPTDGTATPPVETDAVASPEPEPDATETVAFGLTDTVLKNAEYIIIQDDQPFSIQMTDGKYVYGSDPTADDYVAISLADVFAYGDLNGDGVTDAVGLLIENYGAQELYVSLVAVLDQDGAPKHVSSAYLDLSPVIYKLEIKNGLILVDLVVHGVNDEFAYPSQSENRVYRLGSRGLVLTQLTSKTADGDERDITIESPTDGSEVGRIFPLKGSITIAPFENNLVVKVFDANENQVYIGPLAVTSEDMGMPGTFDASISLDEIEIASGPIRIEVSEVSMADGSNLSLASVVVVLK